MDDRLRDWRPNVEEIERILVEMRPIIAAFARRSCRELGLPAPAKKG